MKSNSSGDLILGKKKKVKYAPWRDASASNGFTAASRNCTCSATNSNSSIQCTTVYTPACHGKGPSRPQIDA